MRIRFLSLLGLALTLSLGCGGSVSSPLGERIVVKGKVTLSGGKPLTRGSIVFTPVDPKKGDEQTGDLSVNTTGEYITSVFPGKYKVSISDNPYIPKMYQSPTTTDLEIEIKAAKDDANFELKSSN